MLAGCTLMQFKLGKILTRRCNYDDSTQVTIIDCDPLFDQSLWTCKKDLSDRIFQDNDIDLTSKFKERYMVGRQIGSGSYASVRHCIDKNTLKPYALKIYNKQMTQSRKKSIIREIRLLQMIKHPNIIKIYDAIETNNHINLLLELVEGQSHSDPKSIIYQAAQALNYLHSRHISHRDIKLENIIYQDKQVKIIDFGFSTLFDNNSTKKIYCGTPSYMAPEIVRKTYYKGPPVDIWALGVVLYYLKSNIFPFKGDKDKDLFNLISKGHINYSRIDDYKLLDLLQSMLKYDPEDRITASQILVHPWFQQTIPPKMRYPKSTANSPKHCNPYQMIQSTVKKRESKQSMELINIYQLDYRLRLQQSQLSSISTRSPYQRPDTTFEYQ